MPRLIAGAAAFGLALAWLSGIAAAAEATTVFSTLPVQVEGQPPNDEIVVSADKTKRPTGEMKLAGYLGAVPSRAMLKSCALRLVTRSGLAAANDNGVHLQLFAAAGQISARTVDPGTAAGTAIVLQTKGLCDSLKTSLAGSARSTAQLRLQTITGNGKISFYGAPGKPSSEAPRLLLTYELPDSWPGRADWAQSRADAQHSGRSAWRMYDANGANTTSQDGFWVRPLGKATFANVSPPVLLYGRRVLAVAPDGDALRVMNSDGTLVKDISLPVKPRFIAVSRGGWFYDVGENRIFVRSLDREDSFSIDTAAETVLEAPTIGADGSLYLVTNQYVYAYPAAPVPAAQANVPLWRYRTGATSNNDIGPVALSGDGRTVYVVDKESAQLIALDVTTGAVRWKQAGLQISRVAKEPMPVPVVAGNAVFVTDHAPTGSALYVVTDDGNGATLTTMKGTGILAPVVDHDQSVYLVYDGALQRLARDPADGKFKAQKIGGKGCDSLAGTDLLRADQSGDLYGLNRTGDRAMYVRAGERSVPAGDCEPMRVPDLGSSLAIAANGIAYNNTRSNGIQALGPLIVGRNPNLPLTNAILKLNPDGTALVENNDTTFRALDDATAENLKLPANTNINIIAGRRVSFGPGVRIVGGARLHVTVGH